MEREDLTMRCDVVDSNRVVKKVEQFYAALNHCKWVLQ